MPARNFSINAAHCFPGPTCFLQGRWPVGLDGVRICSSRRHADAGYYVYGTPTKGRAQFTAPLLLSLIFAVERAWTAADDRHFGVGNMSKADGVRYDHATHMKGVGVGLRPLRKDGCREPLSYTWPDYDKEATQKFMGIFRRCFPGQLTTPRRSHAIRFTPAAVAKRTAHGRQQQGIADD